MFELVDHTPQSAVIKVIGVGGGGGNAVNHMVRNNVEGVEFICANTDAQALKKIEARTVLQLGSAITKGLGAGTNPDIGRQAAMEDRERIAEVLEGADMVFITGGMGGGTGTGASPVVARVAREEGALTVAVVTKPFLFEGNQRMRQAEEGLAALRDEVDTLIVIPNQRLLTVTDKMTTLLDAFRRADEVLFHATRGISDLITVPGLINLDFADVKAVMSPRGNALMGTGYAAGDTGAEDAARMAISSPLLEDVSIAGAEAVLVNICGGKDLSIHTVSEAMNIINEAVGGDANVIFGAVIDPEMEEGVRITVIATGFGPEPKPERAPEAHRPRARSESTLERLIGKPLSPSPATEPESPSLGSAFLRERFERVPNHENLEVPTFLRKPMD